MTSSPPFSPIIDEAMEKPMWQHSWEIGTVNLIERDTLEERPDPNAAIIYIGDDRSIEVHGADADEIARLVAAAPELLAACKQAEELIRDGGVVPIGGVTWQLLRAAIALAEGR